MRTSFSAHNTRLLTASVVVALFVSACSSPVAGTPVAGTPVAIPTTVAPEIAVPTSQYNDWFRTLDPCGFVDEVTIAEWGEQRHFGNSSRMNECSIEFSQPVTDARISGLAVTTGNFVDSSYSDLGGFIGYEYPDPVMCSVYVKFDDHQAFSFTAFSEDLGFMSPELFSDTYDELLCSRTKDLVRASVPLFASQPLRSESSRTTTTKLASVQPCGAIPEFVRKYPNAVVPPLRDGQPYACTFFREKPVNGGTNERVDISFGQRPEETSEEPATLFGQVEIDVLGVVAHEDYDEDLDYCQIYAFVGVGAGFPVQEYLGMTNYIDVISVDGRGCEPVRAAATAAVRAYQNN
ncbi:hypothetical protein [Rhodococcus sp. IEGM 1330]|uniref:hypothetical protein n=1 Tax=Rhodococcus sp. IEGM 1330 TaxID=3082225 RepID=UPI0029535CBF|nr:hypothetical protein [Rhodococcus sp. IEGM 1330]MDV8025198.1 hypothetical protein [Rhodococcus sp. IEGM 1330]